MASSSTRRQTLLNEAFAAALEAAAPAARVCERLAAYPRRGPALVLGVGKAAAAMAVAFRSVWPDDVRGMVVTRYRHGLEPGEDAGPIAVVEAGHPLPDGASETAGRRLLALAASIEPAETLWFLCSGGGSAVCAVPLPGITLDDKRAATRFLIRQGADIRAVNCVRKHLSAIKGGRLAAAAHPARVVTLAISDVPGDDLSDIASGPTVPDRTTQADARRILSAYGYAGPAALDAVLGDPRLESPKPADEGFGRDETHLLACADTALDAAEAVLGRAGYRVRRLGAALEGIARELGRQHARLAAEAAASGARVAILSGGETRVVLGERAGRGGRNLEYLAGLAIGLDADPRVCALAADTDGIDGHGDHAGGIVVPDIQQRGRQRGFTLEASLASHDTYRFFDACDLLVRTGPTRTNVNDFRLILCN